MPRRRLDPANHRRHQPTSQPTPGRRIGIYAGAFNPVHAGHVAFALQTIEAARLDQVIFLPERRPRHKPGVEHFAHRVAMLKNAIRPYARLAVMEVVDRELSVRRIMPLLRSLYPDAQFVMLMGSDTVPALPRWPYAERLMLEWEFVVGVRSQAQMADVERSVAIWSVAPPCVMVFDSFEPGASSATIRQALQTNRSAQGLLASVQRYARREWLYISPALAVSWKR